MLFSPLLFNSTFFYISLFGCSLLSCASFTSHSLIRRHLCFFILCSHLPSSFPYLALLLILCSASSFTHFTSPFLSPPFSISFSPYSSLLSLFLHRQFPLHCHCLHARCSLTSPFVRISFSFPAPSLPFPLFLTSCLHAAPFAFTPHSPHYHACPRSLYSSSPLFLFSNLLLPPPTQSPLPMPRRQP